MSCLLIGAVALTLSGDRFTLEWTHSVEKVAWREEWIVNQDGMRVLRGRRQRVRRRDGAGAECRADGRLVGLAAQSAAAAGTGAGGIGVSSSPSMRLAFCTACPLEPLHRLSSVETTSVRPEIRSPVTPIWQKFEPCTCAVAGNCP
jgi:hypothetical protein